MSAMRRKTGVSTSLRICRSYGAAPVFGDRYFYKDFAPTELIPTVPYRLRVAPQCSNGAPWSVASLARPFGRNRWNFASLTRPSAAERIQALLPADQTKNRGEARG